ncbi:hypothetical protein KQ51_00986 [Candidatus Izimaplasma bacterium HR1]|jgi:hypothetical protein|uniref:hypothetical protein n=1 Tax=Candidatus Izimoplasma sp. HR1 TaxID=1541959 RepID=UPI0004F7A103|nr:hypothetical protein KQ51_00986 [Candidatus Izimaplasma bacterium HR1]
MKKILFVVVLIFCLLTTTETAYSYFEEEKTPSLGDSGELYVISQSMIKNEGNLIPKGCVLGINDTYSIIFKYQLLVEGSVTLDSSVINLVWENSNLSEEELENVFNFDIKIDHIDDATSNRALFDNQNNDKLVEITIEVTMNSVPELVKYSAPFGDELSFTYLLTVSKP